MRDAATRRTDQWDRRRVGQSEKDAAMRLQTNGRRNKAGSERGSRTGAVPSAAVAAAEAAAVGEAAAAAAAAEASCADCECATAGGRTTSGWLPTDCQSICWARLGLADAPPPSPPPRGSLRPSSRRVRRLSLALAVARSRVHRRGLFRGPHSTRPAPPPPAPVVPQSDSKHSPKLIAFSASLCRRLAALISRKAFQCSVLHL